MVLANPIAERVSEALGALYCHPNQTLLGWYRYAIYDALVAGRGQPGYAARAWIDVLSARHALFCWQPYARAGWPAAWLQPSDLLRLAEQMLQGAIDPALARRQITRADALADMIGESATSARYPAWCVFEAARRALGSAWAAHAPAAESGAPRAWGADGLDDASWYAAIAVAGGLPVACGEPPARAAPPDRAATEEDAAAQLRWTFFWEWWLREAIPQADLIARSSALL